MVVLDAPIGIVQSLNTGLDYVVIFSFLRLYVLKRKILLLEMNKKRKM